MKVAVVGGIGTGKSTVMNIIRELGGNVILTDELNRALLTDKDYIALIDANFKGVVFDGVIDKSKLKNVIFNDEQARLKLNSLAHPRIFNMIDKMTSAKGFYFVEIPLFEETSNTIKFDKICAVRASINVRAQRVSIRDKISIESALKIIEVQSNEEKVYDYADYIIENDGNYETLYQNVVDFYLQCTKR